MNKLLLTSALAVSLGALATMPAAQAATPNTGTINITGKVVQDTCSINVNGSGNAVLLPTVTTDTLNAAAGTTAGPQNFTLNLTGCDSTATAAQLNFTTGSNNLADGNLKNNGTAKNVEVQLLAGTNLINVGSNLNAPSVTLTSGAGSTPMTARYYAVTTGVTAGTVSTSASVTFSYQ